MLLVTGITGHSGKYLLQELIDNNYAGPIRCLVRENSDTSLIDNCSLNIEKVVGNIEDLNVMTKVMIGVDTVLHIASIFYSIEVINAAVKSKVNRVILVHTTGIYSKYKSASSEYKSIEQTIDAIIRENDSSIGIIYLRPTMIYGYLNDRNMIVFIRMVDKLRLFPIIDKGRGMIQPVNGRDLGKAYYQILCKSSILNGDYILSGATAISMKELFNLISTLLEKRTIYLNIPLSLGVLFARVLKICTFGGVDFVERVQRMGEDRHFSHQSARDDFEYNPMPLLSGLKLEIDEYLKSKK